MAVMQIPEDTVSSPGDSARECPWCGSDKLNFVSRGYTGPTDEVDQYFTCQSCHKPTYEIVAKSAREMRLGRYRPGAIYKEPATRQRYRISRVLKVGVNEFLIYLQPLARASAQAAS
jgi:transposase-like protein